MVWLSGALTELNIRLFIEFEQESVSNVLEFFSLKVSSKLKYELDEDTGVDCIVD